MKYFSLCKEESMSDLKSAETSNMFSDFQKGLLSEGMNVDLTKSPYLYTKSPKGSKLTPFEGKNGKT